MVTQALALVGQATAQTAQATTKAALAAQAAAQSTAQSAVQTTALADAQTAAQAAAEAAAKATQAAIKADQAAIAATKVISDAGAAIPQVVVPEDVTTLAKEVTDKAALAKTTADSAKNAAAAAAALAAAPAATPAATEELIQAANDAAKVASESAKAAVPEVPAQINVHTLFNHPLIFSLSKGDSDPSYIASSAFAKAIMDLLVPITAATDAMGALKVISGAPTKEALELAIPQVANAKLRNSLAALLRSAEGDVDKFKAALEDWFNHSMDRVTGWYKLHAQTWLLILGFILAVTCNVDSIRIIQTLSKNPNLAHAVAAQAEAFAKEKGRPDSKEDQAAARKVKEKKIKEARENLANVTKENASSLENAQEAVNQATGDAKKEAQAKFDIVKVENEKKLTKAKKEEEDAVNWDGVLADFKSDLKELSNTGIPMGWDQTARSGFGLFKNPQRSDWASFGNWNTADKWNWDVLFPALCGWGVTALAASLGAPFWFDMLQRVMNLRGNGRSPDEKDLNTKKADEKKPDGTTKP
jgi:hypothetical protein